MSGSCGFAGYIGVRPCARQVLAESALVLVGFMRGRRLHWCAPWEFLSSYAASGFSGVRPRIGGGSSWCAFADVEFIRGRWVH